MYHHYSSSKSMYPSSRMPVHPERPLFLQAVLEKAQEALGKQNLGTVGLEDAKLQLSELVSKVSSQCLNFAFPQLTEPDGLLQHHIQPTQPAADGSVDSCSTTSEGPQSDKEMHNNELQLRPFVSEDVKENKTMLFPTMTKPARENRMFPVDRDCSNLSISVGTGGERRDEFHKKLAGNGDCRMPSFSGLLDLNAHDDTDAASNWKHFDLNGVSWA